MKFAPGLKRDQYGRQLFSRKMDLSSKIPVQNYKIKTQDQQGGRLILHISGRLVSEDFDKLWSDFHAAIMGKKTELLAIDLARVNYIDSGGSLALLLFQNELVSRSVPVKLINISPDANRIINLVRPGMPALLSRQQKTEGPGFLEQLGQAVRRFFVEFAETMVFVGDFIRASLYQLSHISTFRWNDFLNQITNVGLDALPVLSLISFLIGCVVAFMSSFPLQELGLGLQRSDHT